MGKPNTREERDISAGGMEHSAPNRRTLLVAAGGVALAAGIGVGALVIAKRSGKQAEAPPTLQSDLASLGRGIDDVALVTGAGEHVRWGDLNGRPRAVFFGFTHCPVVCPVTIWELTNAVDRIGANRDSLVLDLVTLDPARDTPEALQQYLRSFDGNTRGLHADSQALARITRSFEIVLTKRDLAAGDYTLDHTATIFLLDADGRVADVIAYGSAPEVIEARLRRLIQPSGS